MDGFRQEVAFDHGHDMTDFDLLLGWGEEIGTGAVLAVPAAAWAESATTSVVTTRVGLPDSDGTSQQHIPPIPSGSEREEHLDFQTGDFHTMFHGVRPTSDDVTINDFFLNNGAWRPPVPCKHCSAMRLQCFMLQTTTANPNPLTSCSSCVALYRDCSLAERGKRQPAEFETSEPVIGQLHGVNEESGSIFPPLHTRQSPAGLRAPTVSSRKSRTRSVKKTRVLRNWLACHLHDPYPTEEEKSLLIEQSGLNKTQVANWFTNARRRHRQSAQTLPKDKVFPQGSPMPRSSFAHMTPLDRWRSSPPDEEPVSASAIEKALVDLLTSHQQWPESSSTSNKTDGHASSVSGESSVMFPQSLFQYTSSNSASSAFSTASSANGGLFSVCSSSLEEGTSEPKPAKWPSAHTLGGHTFQCTFCLQSFKKKSDWARHERSVHLTGLESWICAIPLSPGQPLTVWRIDKRSAECILCGHSSPTDEHFQTHEFEACAERVAEERTFARKDHLWQHLYKFHGCQKWEGWKPDLNLLKRSQDAIRSRCGFCPAVLGSWEQRAHHVASHFRSGLTMAQWIGDSGIEDKGSLRGTETIAGTATNANVAQISFHVGS